MSGDDDRGSDAWDPLRKVVLPVIAVILFLGLGVGLYRSAGAAYAETTAGEPSGLDCPDFSPLSVAGSDVGSALWYRVDVRVDYGDREPPRVVSTVTVDMPLSEARAGELLGDPGTTTYKRAAYCTLNSFSPPHGFAEVLSPPTARVTAGEVEVVERLSNPLGRDRVDVGPAVLTTSDTERWLLTVSPPDRVRFAPCRGVSIEAPDTWVSVPPAELPTSMSSANAAWTTCDTPHSVVITPDTRGAASVAALLRPPTRTLSDVLFWGAQAVVAGFFIVVLWYWERRDPDSPARWLLLVPVLVLSLLPGVTAVLTDLVVSNPNTVRGCTYLAIVCVVVAAVLWRLRRSAVLAVAVLAGVACLRLAPAASSAGTGGDARSFITAEILSFLVLTLAFSGALNAVGLLLRPSRDGNERRCEAGCWIVGTLVAAGVVYERSSSVLGASLEYYKAAPTAPTGDYLYRLVEADPYSLLNQASPILHLLVPIAVLGYVVSDETRPLPEPRSLTFLRAGALLVFYVEIWNASLWGLWSIPMWLVLGPITYAVLARRGGGDGTDDGVGVRDGGDRLSEVRRAAATWRAAMQEGRNIERAFSRGDLTWVEYWRRSDDLIGACGSLRAHSSGHLTPVETLLADRPGTTPVGNARCAAGLMAHGVAVVVVALIVYQAINPFVSGAQQLYASSALTFLGTVLSQVALWVFGGFAFGLLWRGLPGRTGPLKALLPAGLVAATPIVDLIIFGVSPHGDVPYSLITELLSAAAFWAGLTVVGLVMDIRSLRAITKSWSPRREALYATYGLSNIGSKVAFVLAQGAAVVAIATFVINTVQHPAPTSAQVTQTTGTTAGSPAGSK